CFMGNSVTHLAAILACYKLRAVPINVNTRYVEQELTYLFDDADLVGLVHDAAARSRVANVRGQRFALDVDAPGFGDDLAGAAAGRDFGPRSPDDHYVLYTGGTTGMPKGVVWRQEDIFFGALGGGNPGGPPITDPEHIVASVVDNPAQRLRAFLAEDE